MNRVWCFAPALLVLLRTMSRFKLKNALGLVFFFKAKEEQLREEHDG
jgi:hypothetical protein